MAGWLARIGDAAPRRSGPLPSTSLGARTTPGEGRPGDGERSAPLGRLLREAEKHVARLQRERDKVAGALTGTADHREMVRLGDELASAQVALDEAEERWLALAEEAESRG